MEVLLFGIIAEKAGMGSMGVEASSTHELIRALTARIPELEHLSYALAVDRTVVIDDRPLTGSEELALIPPFAGG